jgi:hypothetical protein
LLNGVSQTAFTYKRILFENFRDTVKLGSYLPSIGRTDVITAWISMPNGIIDPVTHDDTLNYAISGCTGPLSGTYQVGASAPYYKTPRAAIAAVEQCGVVGKAIFELQSQTYEESIIFTNELAAKLTNSDTIVFRSQSGNTGDVIIYPSSGSGIILNENVNNIIVENLTVDARRGNHGIEFAGACTNIVIQNCEIYAQPTSSVAIACVIYRASGGKLDRISIKNNLIDGGYAGVYLYGTSSSVFNTNIILENNTIQNHYSYGLYSYYSDFTNISYNTILSSASSVVEEANTTWYGMYLYYTNAIVTGNKIHQRGTRIVNPYGMYLYNYHYYPNRTYGLIANNEIIIRTTSTYYGINLNGYVRGDVLHNSRYIGQISGCF